MLYHVLGGLPQTPSLSFCLSMPAPDIALPRAHIRREQNLTNDKVIAQLQATCEDEHVHRLNQWAINHLPPSTPLYQCHPTLLNRHRYPQCLGIFFLTSIKLVHQA